jgi:hypothetical protein
MSLEAGKIKRAVTLFISHAWEDKVAFVDPWLRRSVTFSSFGTTPIRSSRDRAVS